MERGKTVKQTLLLVYTLLSCHTDEHTEAMLI